MKQITMDWETYEKDKEQAARWARNSVLCQVIELIQNQTTIEKILSYTNDYTEIKWRELAQLLSKGTTGGKTMIAGQLTEEERGEFVGYFYTAWDLGEPDTNGNPAPWGCPWLYEAQAILVGDTVEQMAINYFLEARGHIKKLLDAEKREQEEKEVDFKVDHGIE